MCTCSGKIEFHDYQSLQTEEYNSEILDSCINVIGVAHAKLLHGTQEKFWHLENLFIDKGNRCQGYGTKLLNHFCQYLWSIYKVPIRVHPAIGQQVMENLSDRLMQQQSSEEELDALDENLSNELQQPDFWERQIEKSSTHLDSERLIEWYCKKGFKVDDSDKKYLWCHPD